MPPALPSYECLKCGHQWIPRKEGTPVRCPSCKSAYWNRPRRGAAVQAGGSERERVEGRNRQLEEEPNRPVSQEADESRQPVDLDLVEIPADYHKRQEPMIRGKGTPVWVLVAYHTQHGMTPEQISRLWGGELTPDEVRSAIAYWRKYPERVVDKLRED